MFNEKLLEVLWGSLAKATLMTLMQVRHEIRRARSFGFREKAFLSLTDCHGAPQTISGSFSEAFCPSDLLLLCLFFHCQSWPIKSSELLSAHRMWPHVYIQQTWICASVCEPLIYRFQNVRVVMQTMGKPWATIRPMKTSASSFQETLLWTLNNNNDMADEMSLTALQSSERTLRSYHP